MTEPAGTYPAAGELLSLARDVADEASAMVLSRIDERHSIETKASVLDLVTRVDRDSEALIVERVLDARPDDGILGEEGSEVDGTSGVDWVIDPIDGTTSFVYGLPGFAVSIAARIQGETVAAVVVTPAIGASYSASIDGPTILNGTPVTCSDCTDLSRALIATGFSPIDERRCRQAAHVGELLARIRDIRRMGSAAFDLAAVAAGQVDAYYEAGLAEWDFAAGELLARRAGCRVIVDRDQASGRAFIAAAAPGIADEFFEILVSGGYDQV